MKSAKKINLLFTGSAIAIGLITAGISVILRNWHWPLIMSLLFVSGILLGFLQPTAAWRWAVFVAVPVVLVFLVGRFLDSLSLNLLVVLPTFLPALIGAYAGILISKVLHQPARKQRV